MESTVISARHIGNECVIYAVFSGGELKAASPCADIEEFTGEISLILTRAVESMSAGASFVVNIVPQTKGGNAQS